MLVFVVIILALMYFREASPKEPSNPPKPTAAPTTGTQSVAAKSDFQSLLDTINNALSTTEVIVSTVVEKN